MAAAATKIEMAKKAKKSPFAFVVVRSRVAVPPNKRRNWRKFAKSSVKKENRENFSILILIFIINILIKRCGGCATRL